MKPRGASSCWGRRSPFWKWALVAGVGSLGLVPPATAAPDPPAAPSEVSFGDELAVRRVNLEVFVQDKQGQRVLDLGPDDFEVFEDGQPVAITNFAVIRQGASSAPTPGTVTLPGKPAAPGGTDAGPDAGTDASADASADEAALHLVVFVDNLHTRPFNRNRVLAQTRQFLRQTPPGTRMMLLTYEREIHVREPLTTDRQQVIDRTFELESLSSLVVQKETERDTLIRRLRGNQEDLEGAVSDIDFYAKSVYNDIELSTRAVSDTLERMAGLPGRKALVYVSDGLDIRPGEDLMTLVYDQFTRNSQRTALPSQFNRHSTREFFRDLAILANAHRVTLYTIDAGGLRASSATAADRGGSQTTDADFLWQINRQDSLVFLAAETGGLATIGTNNFTLGFERILDDLRACYSLAIRPRHQEGDGRYHKLEVKVKKPGLELRYRDGYRDKGSATRLQEATLAALLFGQGRNPLGIALAFQPMQPTDDGFLLPIEVRIPIGKLALLPSGDLARARLRVAVAVANARGDLSPVDQQEVPLEIPAAALEQAKQQVFVYTATLRIGRGRQQVAAAVRDEFAGTDAFTVRAVTLPEQ